SVLERSGHEYRVEGRLTHALELYVPVCLAGRSAHGGPHVDDLIDAQPSNWKFDHDIGGVEAAKRVHAAGAVRADWAAAQRSQRRRSDVAKNVLGPCQDAVELRKVEYEGIVPQAGEGLDAVRISKYSADGAANAAEGVYQNLIHSADSVGIGRAHIYGRLVSCRGVLKLDLDHEVFHIGSRAVDLELIEIVRRKAVSGICAGDGEGIDTHRQHELAGVVGIEKSKHVGDVALAGAVDARRVAM